MDGEPKKNNSYHIQGKVIHVKYKKDYIEVRLEEFHSKSRFNLKYLQTKLLGFKDEKKEE